MKFRKIFIFLLFFLILLNQVFTNLKFSEILPNTIDDANLEYIELHNSWDLVLYLSWYILKDKSWKEFIFNDSYFLNPLEKKKYYRPETKILLNNTDEQLFLYDNFWNLIDSYSYTNSENWKVIIINQIIVDTQTWSVEDNSDELLTQTWSNNNIDLESSQLWVTENDTNDSIIDDNNINTNSWVLDISNDTQSWVLDSFTWSINNYILTPEVKFVFQSPSYILEKDEKLTIYNCDTSKEECKINLDLSSSFTWSFKSSDFSCVTSFWFVTWEENKCNPWTIIVPEWSYDFNFKLIHKINSDIFSELQIQILNKWYIKTSITWWNTFINNVYNDSNQINIEKPEIVVQSWLDKNNECTNKKSCSVNFLYQTKNSKERCLWDFWWAIYDIWLENKCNPWYVKYNNWNYIVKLKVYQDTNPNNYNANEIKFTNIIVENNDKKLEQSFVELKNDIIENVFIDLKKELVFNYNKLKINKVLPNPIGSDDWEFIELINKWNIDIDLSKCILDDILNWWSKPYKFKNTDFIKKWEIRIFNKEVTKINLNNDKDEVNIICDWILIDKLTWTTNVKEWEYLDHSNLDVLLWKALVIEVIENNLLKIQFLNSKKIEKLNFLWLNIYDNQELTDYLNDTLTSEEIEVELDSNKLRDNNNNLLWTVYIWWNSLNKKLIEQWYAKTISDYDFKYKDDYIKAETIAKKNNIWIWTSNNEIKKINESKTVTVKSQKKLEAIITVQWKMTAKKILTWNIITCFDTCSINFDWTNSTWNIKKYNWDFWNSKKFDWKNPPSIKYEKFWNYKVYLAVSNDTWEINMKTFNVNFYKSPKVEKKSSKVTKVSSTWKTLNTNDKIIEQEFIDIETNNNSIYYYIFLAIFWIILVVILLKKEKMI